MLMTMGGEVDQRKYGWASVKRDMSVEKSEFGNDRLMTAMNADQ